MLLENQFNPTFKPQHGTYNWNFKAKNKAKAKTKDLAFINKAKDFCAESRPHTPFSDERTQKFYRRGLTPFPDLNLFNMPNLKIIPRL